MSENSEKCPSQFPRPQGDTFACLVLSDQRSKYIPSTVTDDQANQQVFMFEKLKFLGIFTQIMTELIIKIAADEFSVDRLICLFTSSFSSNCYFYYCYWILFPSLLCVVIQSRAHAYSCQPHRLHNPLPLRPPTTASLFLTPLFTLFSSSRSVAAGFRAVQPCKLNPAFLLVETCRCTCNTELHVSLICMHGCWMACITTTTCSTPIPASDDLLHFTYKSVPAAHSVRVGAAVSRLCV